MAQNFNKACPLQDGPYKMDSSTPAEVVLTLKGAASQTGNLLELTDSSDTVVASFAPTRAQAMKSLTVTATTAATAALIAKGASAQTANLFEAQNSSGTVLAAVDDDGELSSKSATITATGAAVVALIAKGAASQTANLIEAQDSAGTVLVAVDDDGELSSKSATITATGAAVVGLTIAGAASQTANLLELKNSSGTVLASVDDDGTIATDHVIALNSVFVGGPAAKPAFTFDCSDTAAKLGLFSASPVVRPTALTTQLTSITHTAPGTPDYAIQDLIATAGSSYGFVSKDEGNTVLSVILNLQTRVAELETKLVALGALT